MMCDDNFRLTAGADPRPFLKWEGSKRGPVGEVIVTNYEPGAGAPAEEVRSDEG